MREGEGGREGQREMERESARGRKRARKREEEIGNIEKEIACVCMCYERIQRDPSVSKQKPL